MPAVLYRVAGGAEDLVPRHHPGRNDEVLLSPVRRGSKPLLRAPLDARHLGRLHRDHALLAHLEQIHRRFTRPSTCFIVLNKIYLLTIPPKSV